MDAYRRASYSTQYEKNVDDEVQPSAVPDDVIQTAQSDKYWAPHPQTGVFGPASSQQPKATPPTTSSAGDRGGVNGDAESVLEEKAWFRPASLEDVEKPKP